MGNAPGNAFIYSSDAPLEAPKTPIALYLGKPCLAVQVRDPVGILDNIPF